MSYHIKLTDSYEKKVQRFLKKHSDLTEKYQKTMRVLAENPYHPSLRLHKLEGRLNDCYSVSINLSYRIVLYFLVNDNEIVPIDIGNHDTVY